MRQNKPTTLREEFEKEWKDSFAGGDMHNWERGQEVADWWIDKLTSHSTELLQKIEELLTEDFCRDCPHDHGNEMVRKCIEIINQESIQISGDGNYFKKGKDIYKNNGGEWEIINQNK